jgi:hypothetical protein
VAHREKFFQERLMLYRVIALSHNEAKLNLMADAVYHDLPAGHAVTWHMYYVRQTKGANRAIMQRTVFLSSAVRRQEPNNEKEFY